MTSFSQALDRATGAAEKTGSATREMEARATQAAEGARESLLQQVQAYEGVEEGAQGARRQIEAFEGDLSAAADGVRQMSTAAEEASDDVRSMGGALSQASSDAERADAAMREAGQGSEQAAQSMRQAGAAADEFSSRTQTMGASASGAANTLGFELVQAAQDAKFGMSAVANQIPLITEQFTQLSAKTGGTRAAFSALSSSLLGPAGMIGAITLGLPVISQLASRLFSAGEAADQAGASASSAEEEFQGLLSTTRQLNESLLPVGEELEQVLGDIGQINIPTEIIAPETDEGIGGGVAAGPREQAVTAQVSAARGPTERAAALRDFAQRIDQATKKSALLRDMLRSAGVAVSEIRPAAGESLSALTEQARNGTGAFQQAKQAIDESREALVEFQENPLQAINDSQVAARQLRRELSLITKNIQQRRELPGLITSDVDVAEERVSALENALKRLQQSDFDPTAKQFGFIRRRLRQARQEVDRLESEQDEATESAEDLAGQYRDIEELTGNVEFDPERVLTPAEQGLDLSFDEDLLGAPEKALEDLQSTITQIDFSNLLTPAERMERRIQAAAQTIQQLQGRGLSLTKRLFQDVAEAAGLSASEAERLKKQLRGAAEQSQNVGLNLSREQLQDPETVTQRVEQRIQRERGFGLLPEDEAPKRRVQLITQALQAMKKEGIDPASEATRQMVSQLARAREQTKDTVGTSQQLQRGIDTAASGAVRMAEAFARGRDATKAMEQAVEGIARQLGREAVKEGLKLLFSDGSGSGSGGDSNVPVPTATGVVGSGATKLLSSGATGSASGVATGGGAVSGGAATGSGAAASGGAALGAAALIPLIGAALNRLTAEATGDPEGAGENVLATLLGPLGGLVGLFAEGGEVGGDGGDEVPIMAHEKEFVIRAAAAQAAPQLVRLINENPQAAQRLEWQVTGGAVTEGAPVQTAQVGRAVETADIGMTSRIAEIGPERERETDVTTERHQETRQTTERLRRTAETLRRREERLKEHKKATTREQVVTEVMRRSAQQARELQEMSRTAEELQRVSETLRREEEALTRRVESASSTEEKRSARQERAVTEIMRRSTRREAERASEQREERQFSESVETRREQQTERVEDIRRTQVQTAQVGQAVQTADTAMTRHLAQIGAVRERETDITSERGEEVATKRVREAGGKAAPSTGLRAPSVPTFESAGPSRQPPEVNVEPQVQDGGGRNEHVRKQTEAITQKLDEVAGRIESMEVRIDAFNANAELGRSQSRLERAGDTVYPQKG